MRFGPVSHLMCGAFRGSISEREVPILRMGPRLPPLGYAVLYNMAVVVAATDN